MDATATVLAAYDAAGFKMVRLSRKAKSAVDNGWQREENRISLADAAAWVAGGENIGIQCGEQSGGLAVVDCDSTLARQLAEFFLPATLTAAKEGEETPAHHYYIAEGAAYRKVKDVNQSEILALKTSNNGKGHYAVAEPSVHPEKGRYVFQGGFDTARVTRVSADELEMRVNQLGAAAFIAEHIEQGGRHDYAMALTGCMLRNGEPDDTVLAILRAAWGVRDALTSKAERDLEAIVEDTRERLDNNEPATGGGWLNDNVDAKFAKFLGKALGWNRLEGERPKPYPLTDSGNALRLVDKYGDRLHYSYAWKAWLVWKDGRWVRDETGQIYQLAKDVARQIHKDAAHEEDEDEQKRINAWAMQSQSEFRLTAMIHLARSEPGIPITPDELDADPMLLGVENGTVDLRTGELRPPDPADLITKRAPVEYHKDAEAPRFIEFLQQVFVADELIEFVQRFLGYSLTGSVEERALAVLYGVGKNGKSTLVELFQDLMGDYSSVASPKTIMASKHGDATAQYKLAELPGVRFVGLAETKRGVALDEAFVKQITGADTIDARAPYGKNFTYRPSFKIWLSTNHKPEIPDGSEAIWDRLRLIPFTQRFEGKTADTKLPQKLREELPGILAWAVRGAVAWGEHGLGASEAVDKATAEYRAETDVLDRFFDDVCVFGPGEEITKAGLFEAFESWCDDEGEDAGTQRSFTSKVKERRTIKGFKEGSVDGKRGWHGVGTV